MYYFVIHQKNNTMALFYFSRFNIEPVLKNQEHKDKLIKKGLGYKSVAKEERFSYKFSDISETTITSKDDKKELFIVGYIVKFEPLARTEYVVEDGGNLETKDSPNVVISKVRFLLHKESSVLAFQEQAAISRNIFVSKFQDLFNENISEEDFFLELSNVNEEYVFTEKVLKLTNIKKVTIDLIPSNPQFRDRWKDIDNSLKERRIDKYKEVQTSKGDGLGIIIDEETKSKFTMAEDGYGEASVSGTLDGSPKTISTREKEKQSTDAIAIDAKETFFSVTTKLWRKFSEIILRTKHEG